MKTNNTNVLSATLITGAIIGLILMSNGVLSSMAQQTGNTGPTAKSSNNPAVMQIDAAISAIKSGDSKGGRTHLLEAEKSLEGVASSVDAEKRVEAAIKILKEGDSNGSISQAEQAKKLLSS